MSELEGKLRANSVCRLVTMMTSEQSDVRSSSPAGAGKGLQGILSSLDSSTIGLECYCLG